MAQITSNKEISFTKKFYKETYTCYPYKMNVQKTIFIYNKYTRYQDLDRKDSCIGK